MRETATAGTMNRNKSLTQFYPHAPEVKSEVAHQPQISNPNIDALVFRIGFGGRMYCFYNEEPPKPYSNY